MGGFLAAAVAGLASGVLAGLFGIGGALLTTPFARLALGYPELVSVGSSLAVVVPAAVAGAASHVRLGSADRRAGLTLGLAGAPFAVLGAAGARLVGGGAVLLAVAVVLAVVSVRMWIGRATPDREGPAPVPPIAGLVALGAATGAFSGLLGLGGGVVMVPALVTWFGFPPRTAAGTSLVAIVLLAVPGAAAHAAAGHVDPLLSAGLAVGVVPGAIAGARLAHRLTGTTLRRVFALALFAAAALLARGELGVLGGA